MFCCLFSDILDQASPCLFRSHLKGDTFFNHLMKKQTINHNHYMVCVRVCAYIMWWVTFFFLCGGSLFWGGGGGGGERERERERERVTLIVGELSGGGMIDLPTPSTFKLTVERGIIDGLL